MPQNRIQFGEEWGSEVPSAPATLRRWKVIVTFTQQLTFVYDYLQLCCKPTSCDMCITSFMFHHKMLFMLFIQVTVLMTCFYRYRSNWCFQRNLNFTSSSHLYNFSKSHLKSLKPLCKDSADLIQRVPQSILVFFQPHSLSLSIFLLSLQHGDRSLQPTQPLLYGGLLGVSWLSAALSLQQSSRALTQSLTKGRHRSQISTSDPLQTLMGDIVEMIFTSWVLLSSASSASRLSSLWFSSLCRLCTRSVRVAMFLFTSANDARASSIRSLVTERSYQR